MGKISELLNYKKKGEAGRKGKGRDFSNPISPQNLDSSTREKLADTYILNPVDKNENVSKKLDKKIPPFKHDAGMPKARSPHFFPWLISFLAVLLLLVNIAYRGKINVKIEVLKEGAIPPPPTNVSKNFPSKKDLAAETKSNAIFTALIVEGRVNRYIIKKIGFYGAALGKSRVIEEGLFLFNDGTTNWASVGLDFAEPMDLSSSSLDFFIKGGHGRESLNLILRDAENNSYMPQAHNIIFNKNMAEDWQFVSIPLNNFDGAYNPKRVNHIGFEFGTQTTLNEPGVSIYIKNIKIVWAPPASYEKAVKRMK